MDGILFVLRTGCQWNAMIVTGICSSSTAHRQFQQWIEAGVFLNLWSMGLREYDELQGIDWFWQSMDGVMTKASLGGGKTGPNPTDRAQKGIKRSLLTNAGGVPIGLAIDGDYRRDRKLVEATLKSIPVLQPDAVGEEAYELSGSGSFCLCRYHVSLRPGYWDRLLEPV